MYAWSLIRPHFKPTPYWKFSFENHFGKLRGLICLYIYAWNMLAPKCTMWSKKSEASAHSCCYLWNSVKTLQTQDTTDPRHFGTSAKEFVRHLGTSAKLSRHIGTSAEMCCGHFGHKGRHLGPRQQWARQCQPSTSLIIWNGWCDIDHRHGGQVAE